MGDLGLIPELGRSPGEGEGYPLQYSGLENSMDCVVHGVAKGRTRLRIFLTHTHTHRHTHTRTCTQTHTHTDTHTVALQCCVGFCCAAKRISHQLHLSPPFGISFPVGSPQSTEYLINRLFHTQDQQCIHVDPCHRFCASDPLKQPQRHWQALN